MLEERQNFETKYAEFLRLDKANETKEEWVSITLESLDYHARRDKGI